MAAIGYQFRSCKSFPELLERGREVALSPQQVLIAGQHEPAMTKLFYEYTLDYKGYHKYQVVHESVRNMEVRFEGHYRNQVIERTKFEMFLAADGSHVFVGTSNPVCEEMTRRAQSKFPPLVFKGRTIDLKRMHRESNYHISGGWFKDLDISDVNAAALYGAEVSQSYDWERFAEGGTISVLLMNYIEDTASYKVSVTQNGGIVVYNKLAEEVRLELLDRISRGLESFVISNPSSTKR